MEINPLFEFMGSEGLEAGMPLSAITRQPQPDLQSSGVVSR